MLFSPSLYDGDNCDDKAVEGVFESILVKPALREYELARFALHEHPDLPVLAEYWLRALMPAKVSRTSSEMRSLRSLKIEFCACELRMSATLLAVKKVRSV